MTGGLPVPGRSVVRRPFERLIEQGALLAHKCAGFWQCMDTFKDKQRLEDLYLSNPPWKVWRDPGSSRRIEPIVKVA
jgi:glucose-1-phosphate cytidylyltransferase